MIDVRFEHVVFVKCDSEPPAFGTGVLVDQLYAVTARHTANGGKMSVRSAAKRTNNVAHWSSAAVAANHESSDTCLLTLSGGLPDGRPARVARVSSSLPEKVDVVGFPRVASRVNPHSKDRTGLVFSCEAALLTEDGRPGEFTLFPLRHNLFACPAELSGDDAVRHVFSGISGAPVFIDEYVIGIVTEAFYVGLQATIKCAALQDIGREAEGLGIALWVEMSGLEASRELQRLRRSYPALRLVAYDCVGGTLARVADSLPTVAKSRQLAEPTLARWRTRKYRGRH